MAWTKRSTLIAAAMTLVLATSTALRATASSSSDETEMASMVAAARRSAGVPELRADDALSRLARTQAERMAAAGTIFHNDNLARDLDGLSWVSAGENVGTGPSLGQIHDALMRSATHRHNILDARFNTIGIGIVRATSGALYVGQVFAELRATSPGEPAQASGTLPAPAPVPATLAAAVATSPSTLVRAEDGSFVKASFYTSWCDRELEAEDGSVVPASYYDDCNGGP